MSDDNLYQKWLEERFDRIDQDNDCIKKDLQLVKETVAVHGVYWDIVKWGALSSGAISAAIAGFIGLHRH